MAPSVRLWRGRASVTYHCPSEDVGGLVSQPAPSPTVSTFPSGSVWPSPKQPASPQERGWGRCWELLKYPHITAATAANSSNRQSSQKHTSTHTHTHNQKYSHLYQERPQVLWKNGEKVQQNRSVVDQGKKEGCMYGNTNAEMLRGNCNFHEMDW